MAGTAARLEEDMAGAEHVGGGAAGLDEHAAGATVGLEENVGGAEHMSSGAAGGGAAGLEEHVAGTAAALRGAHGRRHSGARQACGRR